MTELLTSLQPSAAKCRNQCSENWKERNYDWKLDCKVDFKSSYIKGVKIISSFTSMQYDFSDVKVYASSNDVNRLFQEHFKEATGLRIQRGRAW